MVPNLKFFRLFQESPAEHRYHCGGGSSYFFFRNTADPAGCLWTAHRKSLLSPRLLPRLQRYRQNAPTPHRLSLQPVPTH